MKKYMPLILSLISVFSLSVTAWATAGSTQVTTPLTSPDPIPVTATYQGDVGIVYCVDIVWGSMEFTYHGNGEIWDPVNLTYASAKNTWTCNTGANVISVTNRSNAGIECTPTFKPDVNYEGIIDGTFSPPSMSFASADSGVTISALTNSTTLTLTGTLPEDTSADKVGEVILTFS